MNRVALYHIETLLWISRLGTFSSAAERLNTTQPAVSARMKELERHLGFRIFRPEGRRMVLTVKGRQLVQQCGPLWSQLETILLSPKDFSKATGIVKIGCGEIAAAVCLPQLLSELKGAMPQVTFEVEIDLTIHLRHRLEAGRLDLAFIVGPVDSALLSAKSIGKVAMLWLISPTLVGQGTRGAVTKLTPELPIWCLSRPSHLYEMMVESLRVSGLQAQTINTCNHVRTLIDVVRCGGGTAILPEVLTRDLIQRGELLAISPSMTCEPIEFFAVAHRSQDDPVVQEVMKRARRLRLA